MSDAIRAAIAADPSLLERYWADNPDRFTTALDINPSAFGIQEQTAQYPLPNAQPVSDTQRLFDIYGLNPESLGITQEQYDAAFSGDSTQEWLDSLSPESRRLMLAGGEAFKPYADSMSNSTATTLKVADLLSGFDNLSLEDIRNTVVDEGYTSADLGFGEKKWNVGVRPAINAAVENDIPLVTKGGGERYKIADIGVGLDPGYMKYLTDNGLLPDTGGMGWESHRTEDGYIVISPNEPESSLFEDIFKTIVTTGITAGVGGGINSAVGGGLLGGASGGAASATASGVINDDLSLDKVLQGAVTGGVTGGFEGPQTDPSILDALDPYALRNNYDNISDISPDDIATEGELGEMRDEELDDLLGNFDSWINTIDTEFPGWDWEPPTEQPDGTGGSASGGSSTSGSTGGTPGTDEVGQSEQGVMEDVWVWDGSVLVNASTGEERDVPNPSQLEEGSLYNGDAEPLGDPDADEGLVLGQLDWGVGDSTGTGGTGTEGTGTGDTGTGDTGTGGLVTGQTSWTPSGDWDGGGTGDGDGSGGGTGDGDGDGDGDGSGSGGSVVQSVFGGTGLFGELDPFEYTRISPSRPAKLGAMLDYVRALRGI